MCLVSWPWFVNKSYSKWNKWATIKIDVHKWGLWDICMNKSEFLIGKERFETLPNFESKNGIAKNKEEEL